MKGVFRIGSLGSLVWNRGLNYT